MKKINIKIYYLLILIVGVLSVSSCSNDMQQESSVRLFRPVLNKPLSAVNNTVVVNMGKLKSAVSYRVEISRDNFATEPLKTIESTDPYVVFDNLLWNTTYQVRAIALATDEELNSRLANFGEIKTERFPSILKIPQTIDIIDIGLNVRWLVEGAAVTEVKIFAATDEALLNPLVSYSTTVNEQLAGLKVIKKLNPITSYTVAIYSNGVLRGYEIFTTKAALPTSGYIVDLRGEVVPDDDGTWLNTKINEAQDNAGTLILDGDQVYKFRGVAFRNSIKIISGYSLTSGGAELVSSGQFTMDGTVSAIDHIIIQGIKFTGNGSTYLFVPQNSNVQITDFEITNCTLASYRGLCRLRSPGNGKITNFKMDNCIVSTIGDYAVLRTDSATWTVNTISFTNSTFYRCQRFVSYNTPSTSVAVTINGCTFFESAVTGNKLIDVNGTAILSSLTIKNTIFGHGGGATAGFPGTPPYTYQFSVNVPQLTTFDNVWDTNDSSYTTTLPGTMIRYSGSSLDLFTEPYNLNFKIKDASFVGKSTAGDPRWRL